MQHQLKCSEVWGGVREEDIDCCSAAMQVSLASIPCNGGKGGDIYYFSVCDGDMLTRVALADVVGHGESVSAVSEWLLANMRARMNDLDGSGILSSMNALAEQRGLTAMTTAAVAGFYREDSNLYFSYAGHHPLLVRRPGICQWEAMEADPSDISAANLPLGVLADTTYEQKRMSLRDGDRLFMYTDGLIEAPDSSGDLFGLPRLLDLLQQWSEQSLPAIKAAVLAALRKHTGGMLGHDDVTFLVGEVHA